MMRALAPVLVMLAALALAPAALAHASLIRSEPADRAVVARSPPTLTLVFNEPVTPLVLRLASGGGEHTIELTDVTAVDATLTVRLPNALPQGTHLVSWRVVSADGHPVGGAFTFSIGQPSAAPPRLQLASDPPLRAAVWLGRFTLYLGLLVGVGGVFYAAWLARAPLPPPAWHCAASALQCGLVAAIVSLGLQGVDVLGVPLSEVRRRAVWAAGFLTSYGATASIAIAAMVLAHVALQAKPPAARRLSALALVGVGAAFASSGHASSAAPRLLTAPAVFAHGIAVALWVGALVPLAAAMSLPERRASELMRFSRLMPAVIAVLLASGGTLAIVQVRQFDALWTTGYGLILACKLALVLAVLALAVVNRYVLTPRVALGEATVPRRLARNAVTECVIALVVFGLVAAWRFTPPPRSLLAAAGAPVHVHIHDSQAMADIQFAPPDGGGRRVTVSVLDGQFGPLAAKEVTLFLSKPESGIERLRLPATHVEGATWRIDNAPIPVAGRWQVRVGF